MIPETLNEFLSDGAPFALSREGDGFRWLWSYELQTEGKSLAFLRGGIDSTMPDVRTSVVNLIVHSGVLNPKGDEVGWERFILYQQDWKSDEEAENDIKKYESSVKLIKREK
jgi:hypothetical protein